MPEIKSKHNELQLLINCLRPSFVLLRKNDPLRMAGSTAFFTTFALPAIIFILVQLFGLFIGRRAMGRGLIKNVSDTLGEKGAEQIRQVIRSIHGVSESWYVLVFGFLFLVFVATTLFSVIKNSLDQVWQIGVKEHPGVLFILTARAKSFAVILLAGILFFGDLLFESFKSTAGSYVDGIWKGSGPYLQSGVATLTSVIIIAAWFIILFRFLADGKPSWKASLAGGLLTGVLFNSGRLVLRVLLVKSNIGYMYGSSGSFVLVLLFVFYSSFIFYYGACFIVVYSAKKQWSIIPGSKAFSYRIEEERRPEK